MGLSTRLIIGFIVVVVVIVLIQLQGSRGIYMGEASDWNAPFLRELEGAIENDLPVEEFEEAYEMSIEFEEYNVVSYCAKAEYLLYKKGVEAARAYMGEIIDFPFEGTEERIARLYCCYAKCNMLQGNAELAEAYIEKAIEQGQSRETVEEVLKDFRVREYSEENLEDSTKENLKDNLGESER